MTFHDGVPQGCYTVSGRGHILSEEHHGRVPCLGACVVHHDTATFVAWTGIPSTDGLKSVSAALDVLECFAVDGELGVSDIARKLGIAKSTAHRLLTALCRKGIAEQNPETGHYRLGLHLFELGQLAQARSILRHVALPTMTKLAATTGHTVNLAVVDGPDVVFLERLEIHDDVHFLGHAGRRFPSHCTSSGKAIAAYNPEAAQARRDAGFPPRVTHTVRSQNDWDRQPSRSAGGGSRSRPASPSTT
jgi:DNA-binding IclR family transcriptional regulator